MRHASKLLTAIALGAALIVSSVPAAAQTGRVGGTIKDSNGQPIKGATVVAENPASSPSSFTATTDDKGRFSIIGLRSGTWKITASAPGFTAGGGNVPIRTIGAPNPPIDIVLAPGAPGATGALAGVDAKALQVELGKAEEMLNAQQYDAAIAAYEAILAKTPALTMINLQIGRAHRLKKDYDAALGTYKKMLEANPNDERAKIEIGMTNLEKGDFAAAEAALTEASQSVSASREVFYNLGEIKFNKGDQAGAEAMYKRAADMDASWQLPKLKLGLLAFSKGDKDTAIKIFEGIVAADPNAPEAAQANAFLKELKK